MGTLKTSESGTLTVHWGTLDAGVNNTQLDRLGSDPNAGVYKIREIVNRNRLRISPAPKQDGKASYSIGRFNHVRQKITNTEFFYIDTRSHRQMHDLRNPFKEGISILGESQKRWLKNAMRSSKADFLFIISSVNLMVPHVRGRQTPNNKDEAWTAVAVEREELIDFWDSLGKPVFVLTGDLHNSFAIKITDRVWEFASGPHNSSNHRLIEEANRPTSGTYESRGRECEIRWSTFVPNEAQGRKRRPVYTVVQVNNTFRVPGGLEAGQGPSSADIWAAYDVPQVTLILRWAHGRLALRGVDSGFAKELEGVSAPRRGRRAGSHPQLGSMDVRSRCQADRSSGNSKREGTACFNRH